MKINLGSGPSPLPDYHNDSSSDIRQLPYSDGIADEIRLSHVLEHVSHRETAIALAECYRVLKPGGLIKVAVPDFALISHIYATGQAHKVPLEGYLMGGHTDDMDVHRAIFDAEKLKFALRSAGFLRVEKWQSSDSDCSSLQISLNLMAKKPTEAQNKVPKIHCVMSVPRLGFMDNFFCVHALAHHGIPVRKVTGAFWGQCLERGMTAAIEEGADYILTMDYDTVFTDEQLSDLVYTVRSYPEFAAVAPLQVSRSMKSIMMTIRDAAGDIQAHHAAQPWYDKDAIEVDTAHFGLTMINVEALKKMPHPWFQGFPNSDGKWEENRIDDDIYFWQLLKKCGLRAALATRVPIGHMELMVRWPGQDMSAIYQTVGEWQHDGPPGDTWK